MTKSSERVKAAEVQSARLVVPKTAVVEAKPDDDKFTAWDAAGYGALTSVGACAVAALTAPVALTVASVTAVASIGYTLYTLM
jgi:hypothetical protein